MKEKITQLMKSEGLTSSRLAELLEIQPSGISHILSGRNKPRFDLLQKILRRFPRINPDWLLLDSSKMYRDDVSLEQPTLSADDDTPLPIDLFGFGGALSGDFLDGAETTVDANGVDSAHGSQVRNMGLDGVQNMGQNFAGESRQNGNKNNAQFAPQNMGQNGSQNPLNFASSRVGVERIIVLYSDGTFRTYSAR